MKKKVCITVIVVLVILAVLVVPVPTGVCNDGGTTEYTALTYKIVHWNRLTDDGVYEKISIYPFPDNFQTVSALWEREADKVEQKFQATLIELNRTTAVVEPMADEWESRSGDRIAFSVADLGDIGAEVGSLVEVTYVGPMMETYPAQIHAVSWRISMDLRHLEYTEQWLDKQTAEKYDSPLFYDIVITKIYGNCFFARAVVPMPYEIKLNGSLSEDWCVGDQIITTHENVYYDKKSGRIEADLLTVEASDFEQDPNACYKPVIYLYPQTETQVRIDLNLDGRLTCTYPAYDQGWMVTAAPDGTLNDDKGQNYNYLYWEGETGTQFDMTKGFCVKGKDTAVFLEDALAKLGLNRREANEFIVYWLPLMQENPFNIISFQSECYTDAVRLTVDPAPDTVIRVFMAWQASECYVPMEAQTLTAPQRQGFTLVEWGGTELRPNS